MKTFVVMLVLLTTPSAATHTAVNQENYQVVNIDCGQVGSERSQIAELLADNTIPERVTVLKDNRAEGTFTETQSEELLQLQIVTINLQARDAILEHAEYLCFKQNAV